MILSQLIRRNAGFILVSLISLLFILFIYQSVFQLEFQGDSWQYSWGHKVFYNSTLFSELAVRAMRTSLGGGHLTFALIQNNFGLNATLYYSISIVLKLISVMAFYVLAMKLTKNFWAAFIASLVLVVTFAGVEATHWVFNMYAYIGLTFIIISIITCLDLPKNFTFKKWLISFLFACAGVWYATMRTNGIIPLIIFWSFYQFLILRTKDSRKNLIYWVVGFVVFILIDKFVLGQMESDYSQKYIINVGLQSISSQISANKFDFLLSSATNLGGIILPDITWYSLNFPKIFSLFGSTVFGYVLLPSFLIFAFVGGIITSILNQGKGWFSPKFRLLTFMGFIWTMIIFVITNLGPLNFNSWINIAMTLFGGYLMILCLSLIFYKEVPEKLKNLFFFSFFWSFLFLLLPLFQNGGPMLGTYHRYMVTTAPSVALFIAGLLALVFQSKNELARFLVLIIALFMVVSHGYETKSFFARKAVVHNKDVSTRIWTQFKQIVPNKPEYLETPPTIFFTSADNRIDQETLFESLYFGFIFRVGLDYNWWPDKIAGLYNQDYKELVEAVKKNPKLMDDFYAVMVEGQSLRDITKEVKEKVAEDIQS